MNDYLFPNRLTRRDFVRMGALAAAGVALDGRPAAAVETATAPVRIGSGHWTYTLDESWGKLPTGMKYGFGCGIVVDSRDRVYVTSRSASPAVAVFSRDGHLLETWSTDFATKVGYTLDQVKATAHGIYCSQEGGKEFLYFTENVIPKKEGGNFGKRVYKTDLQGKVLYTIGNVEKESSTSQKFTWSSPTDVAVAPNGDIYVVDGYGSQIVSRFDKNFKHLKTIGKRSPKSGKNAEHGTFDICHGVWVNTLRKGEPEIYIADRKNERIEVFDLELKYKRTLADDVRNPCCFYQHKDHLYIPDLGAQVTILDAKDKLVAHLGDGREADGKTNKPDNKTNPALFATPHALCVDSRGDLYVIEWLDFGRPRKFKHTPMA